MVFKTKKLKIADAPDPDGYDSVDDVPGIEELKRLGYNDIIDYLKLILDRPALVAQVVDTLQVGKIAYNKEGEVIAAYGFKVIKQLGKGKDGSTFFGVKYNDPDEVTYCVKITSAYAKNFVNHTQILNHMFKWHQERKLAVPRILFDHVIKSDFSLYKLDKPFKQIGNSKTEIRRCLYEVCKMNAWLIDNTGFVFWDLGYGNGRNFMYNKHKGVIWVDYGGAGMLRCFNFEEQYDKMAKGAPVLLLEPGSIKGKENLIYANSDFILCQFLLNLEYWYTKDHEEYECTADLYSSILQVKKPVIKEIKQMLPGYLKNPLAIKVLKEYGYDWDWCKANTWNSVGQFINANP